MGGNIIGIDLIKYLIQEKVMVENSYIYTSMELQFIKRDKKYKIRW